jgi:hypothetical protein
MRHIDRPFPYTPPDFDPGPFDTDEVNRRCNRAVLIIVGSAFVSLMAICVGAFFMLSGTS